MKSMRLLIAAVIIASPLAAQADVIGGDQAGFFAGGSVGQSRLKVSSPDFEGSGSTQETGFKLIGGYQFNPYFSLEASYYNPGKFSESEDGASLTLDVEVVQFSAVAAFPIAGAFEGYGHIGVSRWDADLTGSFDGDTGTLSDKSTDLTWGLGVKARLTDNLTLRAGFEQTEIEQPVGDLDLDWELRFFSVGAVYNF
jgi:OOP family OmpA-OmpF porin